MTANDRNDRKWPRMNAYDREWPQMTANDRMHLGKNTYKILVLSDYPPQ